MAVKDVRPDPVSSSQRPHRPGREERRRDPEDQARDLDVGVQVYRERLEVGEEEWQPDEGWVVLDPPGCPCDELVRAPPAEDPEGAGGEEDGVGCHEDGDLEGAVIHIWPFSGGGGPEAKPVKSGCPTTLGQI